MQDVGIPHAMRGAIYFGVSQVWLVASIRRAMVYSDPHLVGAGYLAVVGGLMIDPIMERTTYTSTPKVVTRSERKRLLRLWAVGAILWVIGLVAAILSGSHQAFTTMGLLAPLMAKPHCKTWWPVTDDPGDPEAASVSSVDPGGR